MNAKRILAGACIALACCLSLAFFVGIVSTHVQPAVASTLPGQLPVFGNTQLVLSQAGTGTTTLNLSGTASTSIPCYGMLLTCSNSAVLMGSTSATCTFPMTQTSTPLPLDKQGITNVNQLWFSLTNSTTGTVTGTINACYAQ